MDAKSISGNSYFVTIINDHSTKVWALVLKSKYRVFDVFKHLHEGVETETGRLLKYVRVDNGSEYKGPFEQYYKEHDIKLENNGGVLWMQGVPWHPQKF